MKLTMLLMYISNGLIILTYLSYFIIILLGRRKAITESDGFNITKNIINEYNRINIILNNGSITLYNLKRNVIKIAKTCYYGNTLSDVSIPLIEAGNSLANSDNNNYIKIFKSVLSNLKLLYIFPLIAVFINSQTFTISDAKASIIFIAIFIIINYMLISIKNHGLYLIDKKISKIKDIKDVNKKIIINFIKKINNLDKLLFLGEFLIVFRCLIILFS